MDLGTVFSVSGSLVKVRMLQRSGIKVAACTVSDESSQELSVLVSKPAAIVQRLLDPSLSLPRRFCFCGVELVRKQSPVVRSTDACRLEDRGTQGNQTSVSKSAAYIQASKELVAMGYDLELVMSCIRQLQRELVGSTHSPVPDSGVIVARVLEKLGSS